MRRFYNHETEKIVNRKDGAVSCKITLDGIELNIKITGDTAFVRAFRGNKPINVVNDSQLRAILNKQLNEIPFSDRLYRLLRTEFCYLGDIVKWTDGELLGLDGIGKKFLAEIHDVLARNGLTTGMRIDKIWKRPKTR